MLAIPATLSTDKASAGNEPQGNATSDEKSLAHWMGQIDGDRKLSSLSIPGTHDSGAVHELLRGTAQCQTLSIPDQLAAGVRFLDIRCRHVDNTFLIYHGFVDQHLTFAQVARDCLTFLQEHPSEAILMSIKEEYEPSRNTRSFPETFDAFVQKNGDRWFLGDSIPCLKDVRGKIVLLRRFTVPTGPRGIDASPWANDSTFSIPNRAAPLSIQDRYIVNEVGAKWEAVQSLYQESAASKGDILYLNFTSGFQPGLLGVPNIRKVSNTINPKLTSFFSNAGHHGFGVSVMDFVTPEICRLICNTNH